MKKTIIIAAVAIVILGMICLIIGGVAYQKEMQSIDIIGGADGPTAMFVAGDLAGILVPSFAVGTLLIVGVLVLVKKKQHN